MKLCTKKNIANLHLMTLMSEQSTIYLFVHIFIFRAASDFPSRAWLCL